MFHYWRFHLFFDLIINVGYDKLIPNRYTLLHKDLRFPGMSLDVYCREFEQTRITDNKINPAPSKVATFPEFKCRQEEFFKPYLVIHIQYVWYTIVIHMVKFLISVYIPHLSEKCSSSSNTCSSQSLYKLVLAHHKACIYECMNVTL